MAKIINYQALFDVNVIEYDLTEQLVVFGLFDHELPPPERKAMAERLLSIRRPKTFPCVSRRFPLI